jgi:hypothetical protein
MDIVHTKRNGNAIINKEDLYKEHFLMIRERCYFMGGCADGKVLGVRSGVKNVVVPGEPAKLKFPSLSLRFVMHEYARTRLTHLAPHPLHGEFPLTVYAWTV